MKAVKREAWAAAFVVAGIAFAAAAAEGPRRAPVIPNAEKPNDVARGRYLSLVGGCNDCHTSGFAPSGGKVPEDKWLLGEGVLGFRGPWGLRTHRTCVASLRERPRTNGSGSSAISRRVRRCRGSR